MSDVPIYRYVYGFEYLGLGKVLYIWYQRIASTPIALEFRVPRWDLIKNKEVHVPDRNIGVPPVRKYANYRTLEVLAWNHASLHKCKIYSKTTFKLHRMKYCRQSLRMLTLRHITVCLQIKLALV